MLKNAIGYLFKNCLQFILYDHMFTTKTIFIKITKFNTMVGILFLYLFNKVNILVDTL